MKTITCPYCGEKRPTPTDTATQTNLVIKGGPPDLETKAFPGKKRQERIDEQLQAANEIIDIRCISCHNTYQYNTRIGNVLP